MTRTDRSPVWTIKSASKRSIVEQRFFFGLLMWGEGNLTPNYILFCFIGSLGALQFVAGKYARRDLTPLPPRAAQMVGVLLVACAFVWFFSVQPDLFIPGLAGGEFLVYSFVGFIAAFFMARAVAWFGAKIDLRAWARTRKSQADES